MRPRIVTTLWAASARLRIARHLYRRFGPTAPWLRWEDVTGDDRAVWYALTDEILVLLAGGDPGSPDPAGRGEPVRPHP